MATKLVNMDKLTHAAERDAWLWLEDAAPDYADGVSDAVRNGADANTVYRHVQRQVGLHREALALRCKLAAAYLIRTLAEV